MSIVKILVWSDVLDAGNLIKRILDRKDRETFVCSEEKEVFAYIQSNKIDIALLDVNMRVTNGIKRFRSLKKSIPTISVVMLLCCPDFNTKKEALLLGASGVWVKPMDNAMLEAKLDAEFIELNPSFFNPNKPRRSNII